MASRLLFASRTITVNTNKRASPDPTKDEQQQIPESLRSAIQQMIGDSLRETLTTMRNSTAEMHAALGKLHTELKAVTGAQRSIMSKIETLAGEVLNTSKQSCENSAHIASLTAADADLRSRLNVITRKLNHVEQLRVDRDAMVSNVEQLEGEDTRSIITRLSKLLDVDVKGIKSCRRLHSVNCNRIAPIVVHFDENRDKQNFVNAARKRQVLNSQLGGTGTRRVYVNHRMTNTYQEIDRFTRKSCSKKGYKVWYSKGSFFLRHNSEHTPIEVQSFDDIPTALTTLQH